MSASTAELVRKIGSAEDLQSVVRTMKAIAASRITQYEASVRALADYYRTVQLGLGACLRAYGPVPAVGAGAAVHDGGAIGAVVFGSDQGLVGAFNQQLADYTRETLAALPGPVEVWAVGERVQARLAEAGVPLVGLFTVPHSVKAIAPLVGRIQIEREAHQARQARGRQHAQFYVFHHRPRPGGLYQPVHQRLLPLDARWESDLAKVPWPTRYRPEVLGGTTTLRALIREHLFISLFQACAESLASENASRLAAMERADRNIDSLLETLHGRFHRLRQGSIDEELFEVVAGHDALDQPTHAGGAS